MTHKDGALRELLHDQYCLTDDRSRRSFYTLLSVTIVLGYLLRIDLKDIVIPSLGVDIDATFAKLFGPLALVLVYMNYHYLNAYSSIALGRFVKTAIATGGSFENLSDQELKILVKRRSLAGKMNPYSMNWFFEKPFRLSVPRYLWTISEFFWMICIALFNIVPMIVYVYAIFNLRDIAGVEKFHTYLLYGYLFLGLGLVGTPVFWALRVKGSRFRLMK